MDLGLKGFSEDLKVNYLLKSFHGDLVGNYHLILKGVNYCNTPLVKKTIKIVSDCPRASMKYLTLV